MKAEGRWVEATSLYEQALKIDTESAEAHFELGQLRARSGAFPAALENCERAMELKPEWAEPLAFASSILAAGPDPNLRDTARAIELAERGAELTGHREPRILNTLAFAYASADRMEEALAEGEALEPDQARRLALEVLNC